MTLQRNAAQQTLIEALFAERWPKSFLIVYA